MTFTRFRCRRNIVGSNNIKKKTNFIIIIFTAIGFAPGGSSPTLVQRKKIKQPYTLVPHNTIQRKQHTT
jgi:hypothetical protein